MDWHSTDPRRCSPSHHGPTPRLTRQPLRLNYPKDRLGVAEQTRITATTIPRTISTPYETPPDTHPTKGGYVLVVRYGPGSDWVRNILDAGTATLRVNREEHRLESPRLVSQQEAVDELATGFDTGRAFFKAEDYLLMDHSS